MKVLFTSIFALFLATSAWATGEMPNPASCTESDLGTSEGPLNIDLVWEPNTINTTWYSNGTPMTVDSAYQSCTYNAPLTPPTPADRPGYVFGGWRLKRCEIPSTDINNAPDMGSIGCLDINGPSACVDNGLDQNAQNYGISDPGQWGISWSNGDKVEGEAKCSALRGDHHDVQWGGDSSDWTSDETTLTNASGETKSCWCKVTHYTANNAQQCSLSSPAWVFVGTRSSAAECAGGCAAECANRVYGNSGFRVALFGDSSSGSGGGQACLIPSSLVSDNVNAYASKSLDGTRDDTSGGATAETYGLTELGQWGVTWSNGDKVVGEAKCSAKSGDNHDWEWGGNSADWTATESELTNASGETLYCWCRAIAYTPSGGDQCQLSSSSWLFFYDNDSAASCAEICAKDCADSLMDEDYSDFRPALFGGLVAE